MAKKGQKFKVIDEVLILKIVKEKISGKSYSYLSSKYKVSIGSIKTWVRRFNYKGYINREKKVIKKNTKNIAIKELRIEVDILKKFHAFLNQRHKKNRVYKFI